MLFILCFSRMTTEMLLAFSMFHGILENIVNNFMHFLGYLKAFYGDPMEFFLNGNYNLYEIL